MLTLSGTKRSGALIVVVNSDNTHTFWLNDYEVSDSEGDFTGAADIENQVEADLSETMTDKSKIFYGYALDGVIDDPVDLTDTIQTPNGLLGLARFIRNFWSMPGKNK